MKVDVLLFFLGNACTKKICQRLLQNVADKTLFECLYHVVECFSPWFFLLIARYSISHSKFKCSASEETFGQRSKILGGILLKDYFASPWDTPVSGTGTGNPTRTRTRLHGKPIKLKIHRVTPVPSAQIFKGYIEFRMPSEHRLKFVEKYFYIRFNCLFFSYNILQICLRLKNRSLVNTTESWNNLTKPFLEDQAYYLPYYKYYHNVDSNLDYEI